MAEKTTIEITRETWSELNARKEFPGDSFEDVVSRMLTEGNDGEAPIESGLWTQVESYADQHDLDEEEALNELLELALEHVSDEGGGIPEEHER